MWKIVLAIVLSLILTMVLVISSSVRNRVIQVFTYHDSVNVINGDRQADVYSKNERIAYELKGSIIDTSIHSMLLKLSYKGSEDSRFSIPIKHRGKFAWVLRFPFNGLTYNKSYHFTLETQNNEVIDSGTFQLNVMAEVYGKSSFSQLIIVALGTLAALLQIFQLSYLNKIKKKKVVKPKQ
jgi:uncharacterized membrane protein YuzA (DUF378 family)